MRLHLAFHDLGEQESKTFHNSFDYKCKMPNKYFFCNFINFLRDQ